MEVVDNRAMENACMVDNQYCRSIIGMLHMAIYRALSVNESPHMTQIFT